MFEPELDMDTLENLIQFDPYDEVVNALTLVHEDELFAEMTKLLQDAGVEFDWVMTNYDGEPAPGEETAQLWTAHEMVTLERLAVLQRAQEKLLSNEPARLRILELVDKMPQPPKNDNAIKLQQPKL